MERLTDFLDTFDRRNVTNDAELKALVTKARTAMKGVDVGALKEEADLRKVTGRAFNDIGKKVEGWLELRPGRKIDLED